MSVWRLTGFDELHELGSGAQGRVVLARRVATGEMVAIKYLAPELLTDPRHLARFRDEVNMLARVANPHVARLHEYVETPRGAAIVMEAVNGVSLRDVLSQNPPLPPEAALLVLKGSLLGLAAAHATGVVHRDYKPANVVVENNGNSKLVDFGIAGLTGEGMVAGTPAYMAPEQWHGAPATPATDVYSATCVFFECVTGHPPYASGETTTLRRMHESAPVPAEAVPETLRPLVAHGMAKYPAQRPHGAEQFVTLLEQLATTSYGPDWERRGWAALGAAAAVLAAAFPAASLGVTGSAALGHGAAHLAAKVGAKGFFGKATGVKVGAGVATAAVAATTVWLVWPAQQHVGGASTGSLHLYVTQPSAFIPYRDVTSADSPVIDLTFTISPARVRPGTTVHVTKRVSFVTPGQPDKRTNAPRCYDRYQARGGPGFYYLIVAGNAQPDFDMDGGGNSSYVSLFPTPASGSRRPPTTGSSDMPTNDEKLSTDRTHYDPVKCASVRDTVSTLTFTVPRDAERGRFLVSPIGPPRIRRIYTKESKSGLIDLASAGPRAEGALPELTVLSG